MALQTWIDLKDGTSRLRWDDIGANKYLYIVGLSKNNPRFRQAIDLLGFKASPNEKFLIRILDPDEKIRARDFKIIWPNAAYAQMDSDQIYIGAKRKKAAAAAAQSSAGSDADEESRQITNELAHARLLGRNLDGDQVYEGGAGRFIYREERGVVQQTRNLRPALFLLAPDRESLDECADGFVLSMLKGEVLRSDDLARFILAVTGKEPAQQQQLDIDQAHEVIDAACVRHLTRNYETANDAYGDSVRLYEYMPRYRGTLRGAGAMPTPLSVIAQRLLGDTSDKTVTLPNAFDGASFAFLPKDTKIRAFRGKRDLSERAKGLQRPGLEWLQEFVPTAEIGSQAMFFNADPVVGSDGNREDYRAALAALRTLAPQARAVLVLAGDDAMRPGEVGGDSRVFLNALYGNYEVEDAFEVARELTTQVGTETTLRVISLRNSPPAVDAEGRTLTSPTRLDVFHTWDEIKARVDESLARAAVREAESDGIDVERISRENLLQRPYIAFSRIGEAKTMVPRELQAPLQAYFSEFEANNGPIDAFVERELGFAGENTLESRFSPEQVDALAMMIARHQRGRGHILADETGIGKGRILAALATWSLKRGKPVVFVTDRANLFSDFARDLRDIGEWGRVKPLVMNTDGQVEDTVGDAGVLAEGLKAGEMRRLLDGNIPLSQTGCNAIFCTYSQISGDGSDKALWLKNQLKGAMLLIDEAHIAAGSDSNIATQIAEMTQLADMVQYSSATWGKSADNLHIFVRALPESVNVATLSKTMKRGGEAFSEVFSSMLAREGAMIRREHDLSKLEFNVEVDTVKTARNNAVADRTAEIMSALAFTAGALKRIVSRMSDINVSVLRDARSVRGNAETAKLFKSRFGTGGMLYQVNRRLNAALNVDNTVRLALAGIEAGRKPVIVFEDTGEAFVKKAMERQLAVQPDGSVTMPSQIRPPTIKDLMHRIVETLQMVKVEEVTVEDLPDLIAGADADADAEEPIVAEEEPRAIDGDGPAGPVPALTDAEVQAAAEQDAAAADAADASDGPGAGPAGAAAARDRDAGVDVARLVVATQGAEGGQGAAQGEEDFDEAAPGRKRRKKAPRKFKMVPFWEIEQVSESDRKTFEDGIAEINRLIESLPDIPLNAPDEIARRLRAEGVRVGELSGRSFTLTPVEGADADKGMCTIARRIKSKTQVNATVRAFNFGELDSLLINRSAATGLSLHASPRFGDRRRRQLIEMQIPENPTDRLQLYGRVNRYDQESFPLVQVASTGIYGEVRHIMIQNKKIAELSANVRSSRDSHAIVKDVPDLLNPLGREVAKLFLTDNPEILTKLDIDPRVLEEDNSGRDLASMLTSRVPLLRVDEQRTVYEQLWAMFEDAVIQAELSGNNPLKPNELDVRAKVGEARVLFGFDHKGLGSAFDGAVFAKRLDWTEEKRPMSIEAIIEIIRANRQKLIDSGRAKALEPTAEGFPQVDMSDLVRRAAMQLEGRARLAVQGTEFKSSDEALLSPLPNPVRRGMARAKWVAANLGRLVPGRIVSVPLGKEAFARDRQAVILDIVPPADRRESQLAQWRVLTIAPGESKPVSTTLNALIGSLTLVTEERERAAPPAPLAAHAGAPTTRPSNAAQLEQVAHSWLRIGRDLVEMHEKLKEVQAESPSKQTRQERLLLASVPQSWFWEQFKWRFVGVRERSAIALTGNMYMASEWAAETKAGTGVIFTDEAGMRHRAILLKDKFKPEWLRFLPVRLWMPGMISRFADKIADGEVPLGRGDRVVVYASFDGAWKATSNASGRTDKDQIILKPGVGVRMHAGKGARKRVNAMLRQAQKKIKEELYPGVKIRPADDPGHVIIKESSRRAAQLRANGDADDVADASTRQDANYVVLQAETPAKLKRAIEMIRRGPGLEIFVPPTDTDIAPVARACMRDYFVERLRREAEGDDRRMEAVEKILEGIDDEEARAAQTSQELSRALLSMVRTMGDDDGQASFDFETGTRIFLDREPDGPADGDGTAGGVEGAGVAGAAGGAAEATAGEGEPEVELERPRPRRAA